MTADDARPDSAGPGYDATEANRRIRRALNYIGNPTPGRMVGAATLTQILDDGRMNR